MAICSPKLSGQDSMEADVQLAAQGYLRRIPSLIVSSTSNQAGRAGLRSSAQSQGVAWLIYPATSCAVWCIRHGARRTYAPTEVISMVKLRQGPHLENAGQVEIPRLHN
ncbi:hypothetical protein VTN96DRAFT_2146 [Rasamsonia emersonii]